MVDEREVLGECDAVLSGYQGGADVGEVILEAVALVKERNPRAVYCCDPVLGDIGRGLFVRPGVPDLIRDRVVPAADLSTPNHYELDYLTGRTTKTLDEVVAAADALRAVGPETVLVTKRGACRARRGTIGMVAVTGDGAWSVTTPELPQSFNGAGDLTAAMFLAQLLRGSDVAVGPGQAPPRSSTACWPSTVTRGSENCSLSRAQDEIVRPSHRFEVTARWR